MYQEQLVAEDREFPCCSIVSVAMYGRARVLDAYLASITQSRKPDIQTCTFTYSGTSNLVTFLKLHPRALLKFVLLTLCSACIITIIE